MRVFARCGKILVVAALVLTTGAHWAALQTLAWTAMLADNLRHGPIAGAVSKTFDGAHPCCLCKAIAAAKNSEKKSEAVAPALKMEFLPPAEKFALSAPEISQPPAAEIFPAGALPSKPPLPPPRRRFV